jgi:acetyl esterase/lipase
VRIKSFLFGLTACFVFAHTSYAQRPGPPPLAGGPPPTYANIAYAPAQPAESKGHLLDLYIPAGAGKPLPLVIWTGGSGWMGDTGKEGVGALAPRFNAAGYVLAGVSVRSSAQVQFPGQLHDIKAAIRWLRANAGKYGIDPDRIAVIGTSSGGWAASMAAVTGDAPSMEGAIGTSGVSSAVQAAVVISAGGSDFSQQDAWRVRPCDPQSTGRNTCTASPDSVQSRFLGCAVPSCPETVQAASPLRYITAADPPIMIVHGQSDLVVPHYQGELLYQALNKACHDAVFISLPLAGHSVLADFFETDMRAGATVRSTTAAGCVATTPALIKPTWGTVVDFLNTHLSK